MILIMSEDGFSSCVQKRKYELVLRTSAAAAAQTSKASLRREHSSEESSVPPPPPPPDAAAAPRAGRVEGRFMVPVLLQRRQEAVVSTDTAGDAGANLRVNLAQGKGHL